jgi:hypothetical protein
MLMHEGSPSSTSSDGSTSDRQEALRIALEPVAAEEFRRRLDLCRACPDVRVLWSDPRTRERAVLQCRRCSCIMNIKARLRGGRCPLGRF